MAKTKRHIDEGKLNGQARNFASVYIKKRGLGHLPPDQTILVMNAAISGFYSGVRFVEDYEGTLYKEKENVVESN